MIDLNPKPFKTRFNVLPLDPAEKILYILRQPEFDRV